MNTTLLPRQSTSLDPLVIAGRIIAQMELTPEQYDLATKSYREVADILRRNDATLAEFALDIFFQGSIRLGTTVRPPAGDRFDLDMVCKLIVAANSKTPMEIYNRVWEAISRDEAYEGICDRKNRCIRITPPESPDFYLDVTPAVPDGAHKSLLLVPDRELKKWCSTHPIAYADDWFRPITLRVPSFRLIAFSNAAQVMASNRVRTIEELPEYGEFEKKPLQRIVQLVKYNRNVHYPCDDPYRPSSIILTTLVANSYLEALDEQYANIADFVVSVIEKMPKFVNIVDTPQEPVYLVTNPVNERENFAEKWTQAHYQKFIFWHSRLAKWLRDLRGSRGIGSDVVFNRLKETFGNEPVIRIANSIGEDTRKLHESGRLRVDSTAKVGILGGAIIPVTTYHGR